MKRPDLTPPLLHVSNYHPEQIEHGYLFIAPYHTMIPSPPSVLWIPSQIGPHIYDMNGVRLLVPLINNRKMLMQLNRILSGVDLMLH